MALSLRLPSSNLKLPTDVSSGSPSTERMLLEIPALTFIYNENVILINLLDTNFFFTSHRHGTAVSLESDLSFPYEQSQAV